MSCELIKIVATFCFREFISFVSSSFLEPLIHRQDVTSHGSFIDLKIF